MALKRDVLITMFILALKRAVLCSGYAAELSKYENGLVKHALWTDSLYFLYLLSFPISKIPDPAQATLPIIIFIEHLCCVVAITSEEEKNCCVDGPIIALLIFMAVFKFLHVHRQTLQS
jgi:hypothetical protein